MTIIAIRKYPDHNAIEVQVGINSTPFSADSEGVEQAITFAKLFRFLLNPKLSERRLEKLLKDMGKDGNSADTPTL